MILNWVTPTSDNGCPITGFKLHRDDGLTGTPTTEVDTTYNTMPALRQATVTLSNAWLGRKITYQLTAINAAGETVSTTTCILFATLPDAPVTAPALSSNGETWIKVLYVFTGNSNGASVVSQQLEYSLSYSGSWIVLNGESSDSLASAWNTTGLTKGNSYAFRYKVKNSIGWSDYSSEIHIVAATVPAQPPAPTRTYVDAATPKITLAFD